jgi:hypothetical protein
LVGPGVNEGLIENRLQISFFVQRMDAPTEIKHHKGNNVSYKNMRQMRLRSISKAVLKESYSDELPGYVRCVGETKHGCEILVGKHEGKRPLRRPRLRWVDNIKIDLKKGV